MRQIDGLTAQKLYEADTLTMALRVAVVEDDAFTRITLVTALRSIGLDVVLETGSATTAIQEFDQKKPELAVLDLHLGNGPTGIDLAIEMRKKSRHIGILFLSSFDEPRLLNPNLPQPPKDSVYLSKSDVLDFQTLQIHIRRAVERLGNQTKGQHSQLSNLSDIQIETLKLMAQGLSNAEIAKRRFVTERSVEIAISRIAKKLGVQKDVSINQRVHIANVYFRAIGLHKGADD